MRNCPSVRIAPSITSGPATPSSSIRYASTYELRATRFTMKPGVSFTRAGTFSQARAVSATSATVAGSLARPRVNIKGLTVTPGARLSLQRHHHRSEHWVVIEGTARITCDGDERLLSENQSTYIPIGARHRLENPGKVPLRIVEVQCGGYLGEDDITRFDDAYGRVDSRRATLIGARGASPEPTTTPASPSSGPA